MAGYKSVNLTLLGNNTDAKEKIEAVQVKAEELKEMHPELAIGIDDIAAKEQLQIFREAMAQAADEAWQAGEKIKEGMDLGNEGVKEETTSLGELNAEMKVTKANATELAAAQVEAGDAATVAGDKGEAAGAKSAEGAEMGEKAWGMAKMAILGVGGAMGFGIYKAAGFTQEMEHLHTQAGVSNQMMGQLSQGVLQLAGQVGQNPDSLAEAAYHVASNMGSMGATSKQMLEAVKVAAQGASVGGSDLVDTTNALGAVIAANLPGMGSYQKAMGALNATVGAGDMTMQNLAEAMGTGFLSNVKIYGTTLNDVSAILATFGDNNIRGAHAGTQLRMSVQSIAVQASTATPYLKQLGLGVGELGKYQSIHGTVATINLLSQKLKEAGVPATEYGNIITQLFGKKAGAGIAVLIDQVDRLNSKQKAAEAGANSFGGAWKAQQQTTQQKMKDLEDGAEALATGLGMKLLPATNKVLGVLNEFMQALQKNAWLAGTLGGILGTVVAGIALKKVEEGLKGAVEGFEGMWKAGKKVVQFAGEMVAKLTAQTAATEAQTAATAEAEVAQEGLNMAWLASPITWIVLAIVGLIAVFVLLWTHCKAFRDFWKDVWHDILVSIEFVWNWIKGNWPYLLGILLGPIAMAAAIIYKHWNTIKGWTMDLYHDVVNIFKSLWHDVTTLFDNGVTMTVGIAKSLWQNVTGFFKDIWRDCSNAVSGFWNDEKRGWENIYNTVVGWAKRLWNDTLGWFKRLPGDIVSALGNLGSMLWNAGASIITGLINGIESAIPGLHSTLSWVTSLIPSWKGPAAVDKVLLRPSGQMIMGGLVDGLNDGLPALHNQLSRTTSTIGSTRLGTAGTSGNGQLQIEWVGGAGADQEFITWLKKNIRIRGGNPAVLGR